MADNTKSSGDGPSETSPLLAREQIPQVSGTAGVAPEGPLADESLEHNDTTPAHADADASADSSAADGAALERQDTAEDRRKQYEGSPELRKKLPIIIPALAVGILLAAADQTLVVASYGRIGSDLKALSLTSWIATSYFLTLTAFQPLYGKLSDIFGRKACLLFAYTTFGTGSVLCGLVRDMPQLIAARAFAGIGAGGMTTVVSILLSDIIPLRERGKWQGYLNIIFAIGSGSGAPLGGVLSDSIGWRWAFLAQGPLCLVAIAAVSLALHLPPKEEGGEEEEAADWRKKLRRIDFPGAIVLLAAVFTLLLALDRGSNVSWRSTTTLVSLGISIPLFALFALIEVKFAREPFAPGHIIFSRSMIAAYLCNFFNMGGWMAAIFYVPLYFQAVEGLSATGASVRLVPSIVAGVTGSLLGGIYMQKTGRYYRITIFNYSLLVVGTVIIVLASGPAIRSTPLVVLGMVFNGLGSGAGATTTLIGLIANASRADQAVATACSYLFRSLGSVFGVSLAATLVNSELRTQLAHRLPELGFSRAEALQLADRVRESLEYLRSLQPVEVRMAVAECYARSTTAGFALAGGLVGGAFVSAWFVREKALS